MPKKTPTKTVKQTKEKSVRVSARTRTTPAKAKAVKKTTVVKTKSVSVKKTVRRLKTPKPALLTPEVPPATTPLKEVILPAAPLTPQEVQSAVPIITVEESVVIKEEPKKEVSQKELEIKFPITVKDLAVKLQEKPSLLIKSLMDMGIMVGINQALDEATVTKICQKKGFKIKPALPEEELILLAHQRPDAPESLRPRPAIVTFMGHVDHGKTSLLDAIRKSKIAESEHGGITQHIGAYRVNLPGGEITFLDTPGHEAFTTMRQRGARITDIVVLVVAADDGVMPQTEEAIDHARAAGVSIVVAINKIDKPQADINRVKKQLGQLNLTPEDWGGKTITVCVSAKTQEGIDLLLEMLLLEAQMLELKANPDRPAKGVVLEAKMVKSRGPMATLLVQNGILHLNDNIIVGKYYGKIRAMFDDRGQAVTVAPPSFPVEVLGISDVPLAGEQFFAIADEKTAKELAQKRQEQEKVQQLKPAKRIGLEDLYAQIKEGKLKELKLILKADTRGSLEAIKETLNKLQISEVKLEIIHEGVGNINTSDVMLALVSNALILGFHIAVEEQAKELITKEGQDVRTYNVIYELASDIKQALEGMLEPKLKRVFLGKAEVKKVFRLSKAEVVAGCLVNKGRISRGSLIEVVRDAQRVYEGEISSLKRFKDDVREVEEGFECGIVLKGFDDIREGDIIEAYQIEKIVRKL